MAKQRSPERAEFLSDIVTTALEGGIGYWSAAEEYRWFSPNLEGGTAEPGPGGTANAYAVLVPDQEGTWPDDAPSPYRLTVDEVARALGLIRKGGIPHWSDTSESRRTILEANRENEGGDIDADLADMIVQVAIFGEVVFG